MRLLSKSKTSSQHKTKKNSQCFLAFTLRKDPKYKGLKLKQLNGTEYEQLIGNLKEVAKKEGYSGNSDMFDFIINRLIFSHEIREFTL